VSRRRSPLTPAATRGVGRGRRRAGRLAVSRRRYRLESPGRAGGAAAASGRRPRRWSPRISGAQPVSRRRSPLTGSETVALVALNTLPPPPGETAGGVDELAVSRRRSPLWSPRRPGARRRCGSCIRSETAALVSSNLRGAARVPAQIAAHSRLHPRSRPWASTSRTARHVRRRSPLRSPRRLGAQTMARAEIAAVVAWKGPGRSPWRRERPVNRRTFPLSEFRSELLAGLFLKRRT